MAFNVVDLPAPLAPSSATIPPGFTSSDTPFSTRMTWSYMTSMLLTARMGVAVSGFGVVVARDMRCSTFRRYGERRVANGEWFLAKGVSPFASPHSPFAYFVSLPSSSRAG